VTTLRGQLLLASPSLLDPNFRRTVVLIGEHNDEGAMGLVLNRPSEVTVADAAPQLSETVDDAEPIFVGGPVAPTTIVLLAEFEDPAAAGLQIAYGIGFPSPDADLDDIAATTRRGRVYAGYAGWGPGQLEGELERGDWITEPAGPQDIFSESAEELWSAVLSRKGGSFALVARMPLDPSLN
jgi:putative transcriptional regulator